MLPSSRDPRGWLLLVALAVDVVLVTPLAAFIGRVDFAIIAAVGFGLPLLAVGFTVAALSRQRIGTPIRDSSTDRAIPAAWRTTLLVLVALVVGSILPISPLLALDIVLAAWGVGVGVAVLVHLRWLKPLTYPVPIWGLALGAGAIVAFVTGSVGHAIACAILIGAQLGFPSVFARTREAGRSGKSQGNSRTRG